MKILAISLALACVGTAYADDTTCVTIGNQLHCHADRQERPPMNTFDPSTISHIADQSDSQHQMLCVSSAARAGMDRASIIAMCLR